MKGSIFLALIPLALISMVLALAGTKLPDLLKEETAFRADREAHLKAPNGWLAVSGLFWLHAGAMSAGSDPKSDIVLPPGTPRQAGNFRLQGKSVTFEPAPAAHILVNGKPASKMALKADTDDHPDVITDGRLSLTVIQRGDKTGIRVRDPEAATRKSFVGLSWYPPSEKWRFQAKWIAYPRPKKIRITNILGMTDDEDSPGYVEFAMGGKTMRLEPVREGNELAFMFRDATSGNTTYTPGRFMDTWLPKDGVVLLDFNQAYNPPCAFTAYATCPLPPRQNHLTIAVEAGEKKYAGRADAGER